MVELEDRQCGGKRKFQQIRAADYQELQEDFDQLPKRRVKRVVRKEGVAEQQMEEADDRELSFDARKDCDLAENSKIGEQESHGLITDARATKACMKCLHNSNKK